MSLELQHFIYSLYPKQGYGISAASPKINKQEWKAFCAPLPVELKDLERLSRVWALQEVRGEVIASLFTPGARDEFNRPGIYSHNILMSIDDYLAVGASPVAFTRHFITDPTTVGELPPLTVSVEDLQTKPDFELLAGVKPNTLEKIFGLILKGDVATLVCPRSDTEQMTRLISALCQLLPSSVKVVSFITAPLSRLFRRERGQERYRIKLVQERSVSLWGTEEHIDIDQDAQAPEMTAPESKSAHYLVDSFLRQGYQGVKTLHEIWEDRKPRNSELLSQTNSFVTAFEVLREVVSLESIRQMRMKGQKKEAKRYARAIVDERKWKSPQELAELVTILIEDIVPQSARPDILLLINETKNLGASDKFSIYDSIIKNLPQMGGELVARLRESYGASFFTHMGDLSNYPAISALLMAVGDYVSFQSISKEVLSSTISDPGAFEGNLRRILDEVRKRSSEHILDFIQHLLVDFPARKNVIARHLQVEDLVPAWVMSHSPKETRQRLVAHAEKVLQVLKEILVL